MFLSWILKTYMTDVLRTSPERPIIWSQGRPTIGSRRRPVDIPIHIFWIFVFPVKTSNRCVKQRLLHLKNTFFIKSCKAKTIASKKHFFHQIINFLVSPLRVPWRSPGGLLAVSDVRTFRVSSGDVPRTFQAGWVGQSWRNYLFKLQNQAEHNITNKITAPGYFIRNCNNACDILEWTLFLHYFWLQEFIQRKQAKHFFKLEKKYLSKESLKEKCKTFY